MFACQLSGHLSAEYFEMHMAGQVVMITGAAGTLGRAVAAAFADVGTRLVLVDIVAKELDASYGAENDSKLPLVVDLADRSAIDAALAAATKKFGRVQVVCNIASGFNMGPAAHETTDDFWNGLMNLNAGSARDVVRAVVPRDAGGGFRQDRQYRRDGRRDRQGQYGCLFCIQKRRHSPDRKASAPNYGKRASTSIVCCPASSTAPPIGLTCPTPTQVSGLPRMLWPT
jgi:NAD(P)-dependent dehydrogenase (short-subunit alcohol dehydrogenase family)